MTIWIKNIKTCFWILLVFWVVLKVSTICRAWSGDYLHPKLGLQNLQHRFLIQWIKGGILYIHEQLQDMGQNIAMELPIMNRFIWKSNQSNYFLAKDEVVIILFQSYNFISISYDFFNVQNQMF
jgi:hypothetical protein